MKKILFSVMLISSTMFLGVASVDAKKNTPVEPHCDYTIYDGGRVIQTGHVKGMWCNEFFVWAIFEGNVKYK